MNHSMDFYVEYEILGKNKSKKKVSTRLEAQDVKLEKYDKRGMKLQEESVPFKSFVRNFGVILARALHGATSWTAGVNTASGVSVAALKVFTATEAAMSASRSKSGVWIGDNGLNIVAAASIGTTKFYADGDSFITGVNRSTVAKSDYFLARRIEAQTTTASAKSAVTYGANSVTVVDSNKLQIKRRFFNDRGTVPLKVAEFGLGTYKTTGGVAGSILLARDTFATSIVLTDEQYLDVTYSFSLPTTNYLNTNFINMLANLFLNTDAYGVLDTTGGPFDAPDFQTAILFKAAVDADYGIMVGNNDNAVQPYLNSYKLESAFSNAVMQKGAMSFLNELDTSTSTTKFGFQRDITNLSSDSVEVGEMGLYTSLGGSDYCMIARTTFSQLIVDPNDVLRVKVYFNFPVASTTEPTLET